MGPGELLNSDVYIEWMRLRVKNPDCIHMFMDENHANVDLVQIYKLQAKLHLINPKYFKLLPLQSNEWQNKFAEAKSRERQLREKIKVVQTHSGMVFHLKPFFALDINIETQRIDNQEFQNEIISFYETDSKIKIDGIQEPEKSTEIVLL